MPLLPTAPVRRVVVASGLALGLSVGVAVAASAGPKAAAPRPAAPAPAPPADDALSRLSISGNYLAGISSGGYMATQLQVAHSSRFKGAGIYSAGPYYCAQGSVAIALQACTADTVPTQLPALIQKTKDYADAGLIDPVANLTGHSTWAFHGTKDTTVVRSVADDLAGFYGHFGAPLTYRNTVEAGHGWVSPAGPAACGTTASPYVNTCSPDPLADMMGTVLGPVKPPNTRALKGTVRAFAQDRYAVPATAGAGDTTRSGAAAIGMGTTGYVYTPPACTAGACRLVVALHGCQQTAEQIGRTFVDTSYLNQYADTNALVVLYPQARPDGLLGNPKGCWDWWGYLGAADGDYATRNGPQMRTVMNMVTALGG